MPNGQACRQAKGKLPAYSQESERLKPPRPALTEGSRPVRCETLATIDAVRVEVVRSWLGSR